MKLEPDCNPAHAAPRALLVQQPETSTAWRWLPPAPLLVNLRALLASYDPDLLLTAWGDTWLLPLLWRWLRSMACRCRSTATRMPAITRRKERWYFSYGQMVYRGEQVHLFGRWHIDRKNAMLWSDYELDGVLEMARVTGLPLQTAARVSPGTGISAIQMQTALRLGILVPWQKQQVGEARSRLRTCFQPTRAGWSTSRSLGCTATWPGSILSRMYPAIMVYCNISPETIGAQGPQARAGARSCNLVIDHSREGLVPAGAARRCWRSAWRSNSVRPSCPPGMRAADR